jgi:hypothetical protein
MKMTHEECLEYLETHKNSIEFSNIGNCYGNLTLSFNGVSYIASVECSASWSASETVPDYVGDALVNYYREDDE